MADHEPMRHSRRHKKRMIDDYSGSLGPTATEVKEPDDDNTNTSYNGKYCSHGNKNQI